MTGCRVGGGAMNRLPRRASGRLYGEVEVFRLLFLLGLGYLVYRLFSPRPPRGARTAGDRAGYGRSATSASGGPAVVGEKMVKCAACGLYVPEHEALRGQRGKQCFYCSEECRKGR